MRPSIGKMAVVGLLALGLVGGVSSAPASAEVILNLNGSSSPSLDYSGNSRDFTWEGDPQPTTGGLFKDKEGLEYDGNDAVYRDNFGIDDPTGKTFTLVLRKDANQGSGSGCQINGVGLLFFKGSGCGAGWHSRLNSNNDVEIQIGGSDLTYDTNIGDGSKVRLTYILKDSGNLELYKNGSLVDSKSYYWGGKGNEKVIVGYGYSAGLDGAVYDFQMYSKELDSTERINLNSCGQITACNTAPSIDSVSTRPESWTLGSDVNVSANVSDSDGSVSSVSADVFENGTEIVSDASLSDSDGDGTWEVSNLFTVDESEVYYNVSVTATDDDGATSTEEVSQFIEDEPPEFNLTELENKTYFEYSNDWTVDVLEDGDNVQDEEISCTTFLDGNVSKSFSGTEGIYTQSSNFFSDLGQHTFKVSCSDPAGNLKNKTVDYTVKAFEHTGLSADSSSFETVEEQFTFDSEVGDMVQAVNYSLVYDGETVETKSVDYSNDSVLTDQNSVFHEIGLVNKDNVNYKYNISADVTYDTLGGGDASLNKVSSSNTQTVDQAYKFGNHTLKNGFTQLEASILEYTAVLDLQTPDAQGQVSATTTFNGTNNSLVKDGLDYSTDFTADLINTSSKAFPINTEYRLEFNGETRSFNNSKSLTLNRIEFSKDSSTGPESIKFKSKDEINDSTQSSALDIGLQVANPDRPEVQRFYGFEFSKDTSHSLYLSPKYADVKVNAFDQESLKYGNQNLNYPDRRYFLLDEVLDNQTSNVELFMLKENQGLNVNLELLDSSRQQLSQHLIRVEKNIPSQETTRIVAMARTGSSGTAKAFLDPDQQYIFSVFNSEGEFIGQIGPQSINVPETTLELTEKDTANFENVINEVRFTDVILQNNSLKVDYVSDTERLNNISLTVYRDGVFNNNKVTSDSSTSLQNRLTVSGFNASNKRYFYELEGTFGEKDFVLSTQSFGQETSDYGNTGLLMSMLIIVSLGIAGALVSFSAAIALTTLGVLVASPFMLGFLPIGQSGLIAVIALASIMIWRGTR